MASLQARHQRKCALAPMDAVRRGGRQDDAGRHRAAVLLQARAALLRRSPPRQQAHPGAGRAQPAGRRSPLARRATLRRRRPRRATGWIPEHQLRRVGEAVARLVWPERENAPPLLPDGRSILRDRGVRVPARFASSSRRRRVPASSMLIREANVRRGRRSEADVAAREVVVVDVGQAISARSAPACRLRFPQFYALAEPGPPVAHEVRGRRSASTGPPTTRTPNCRGYGPNSRIGRCSLRCARRQLRPG